MAAQRGKPKPPLLSVRGKSSERQVQELGERTQYPSMHFSSRSRGEGGAGRGKSCQPALEWSVILVQSLLAVYSSKVSGLSVPSVCDGKCVITSLWPFH